MDETEINRIIDAIDRHWSPCGSIERESKSDRIVFAWPLSNVPTEYVVTIQGSKPVYGRCAIDALGMSAMYGKPVDIEATSVASDAPIRITVNGDRVKRAEPADAVVGVAGADGCGLRDLADAHHSHVLIASYEVALRTLLRSQGSKWAPAGAKESARELTVGQRRSPSGKGGSRDTLDDRS